MNKSTSSEPLDGLSELPDSLILLILSFLPMRDVVRTTLLSKRWKELWTTIACLIFEGNKNDSHTFRNFVNLAMLNWKGTKILKFRVDFIFHKSFTSDLDTWLRIAMDKGVEELYINLMDPQADRFSRWGEYSAPRRLYSCSSIRKLVLMYCGLDINGNVHWDQLKCLTIRRVCLREDEMNRLLSGAPQLEVLILSLVESYHNLNIHSSSLKKLKIEKNIDPYRGRAAPTVLRIWAPNVETLEISGVPYAEYQVTSISSLTSANVAFHIACNWRFFNPKLLEDMLELVFLSIRHLEKVKLSDLCIKVLGEMKKKRKDTLASLSNAKSLKLYATNVHEIVGLLDIFPELTMLFIEQERCGRTDFHFFEILGGSKEPSVSKFDAESSWESKNDLLMPYPLHLKTVEITWFVRDNLIFQFIEFLSKIVRKLEKMMLRVTGTESAVPAETLFLAAEKLLGMQRSFPTAELIMCKK